MGAIRRAKTYNMPAKQKCPICKREVESRMGAAPFGPFCSARCRSIDLGSWLDGRYRIPATPEETEDEIATAPEGTKSKD